MNIKLEIPDQYILVKRDDLKKVVQEVLIEHKEENDPHDIMTIKETANYLKVSIPTVRSLIATNEIPFFRRGQVIRLSRKKVNEWISTQDNLSVKKVNEHG